MFKLGFERVDVLVVRLQMSEVVRLDEYFLSERIGNALARLWTVNGLTLELVEIIDAPRGNSGDACVCTFTTERPGNPGMTMDGQFVIRKYLINAILSHKILY